MYKNIIAQWGRVVFTILIGILMPRLMNMYLGTSLYGSWINLVALVGIISLLALGVPTACVKYVSQALGKKDDQLLQRVVSTCAVIFLVISGVCILFVIAFVFIYDAVYGPKIIDQSLRPFAMWAAAILGVSYSFSFLLRLPYSVMQGSGDFVQMNCMLLVTLALRALSLWGVLVFSKSILCLASVEIFILFFDFLLGYRFLLKKYPRFKVSFSLFDKGLAREIFCFGGWVLFLGLGTKLSFHVDALVIGKSLDHESVAFYCACGTIIFQVVNLMQVMGDVIVPAVSKLAAEGRQAEVKKIFLKWSKVSFALSLIVSIYLLFMGPEFIGVWMNDKKFVEPSLVILPWVVFSCLLFWPVRAVAMPILFGLGQGKKPALGFLVAGLANLILSILLVGPLGLKGVAIGTAIPNLVLAIYVLLLACRNLKVVVVEWIKYVVVKCCLSAVPVVVFLYLFKGLYIEKAVLNVLFLGFSSTTLFGFIVFIFAFKNDDNFNMTKSESPVRA